MDSRHFDTMAVIQAYLDESGTHNNARMVVVGGAIANESSWLSLSAQWEAVLNKYNVSAFHSTDYNNQKQEFDGWPDEERHSFIDTLLNVIKKERLKARAIIFEKKDFEDVISYRPKTGLTDYQFGCFACIQHLATEKHSPIEVVFDYKEQFHNPFLDSMIKAAQSDKMFLEVYGISSITRVKNEGVRPIEVADLIVYELAKAHVRVTTGHPLLPRYQAIKLNQIMKGKVTKLSRESIDKYLSIMEKHFVEI